MSRPFSGQRHRRWTPNGSLPQAIGRLLAAAMSGSQDAQEALASRREKLQLDGHAAEIWLNAVRDDEQCAQATGKVARLPLGRTSSRKR